MTAPSPSLVLRVDATAELGMGHFMRGLAIGQAWRARGGVVTVASGAAELLRAAAERAREEGFSVVSLAAGQGADDGRATRDLALATGARAVVADGYSFGVDFQRIVREAATLLVVDDNAENAPYLADLVLNQNLHARAELYRDRSPGTQLLLGPRFTLLRQEFAGLPPREPSAEIRRVVVTMGGTDPRGLTRPVVEAVHHAYEHAEILAIVGASVDLGPTTATLLRDARNMAHVFTTADLVVCAAGSTAWELAAAGTPMVLVVSADNQRGHARALLAEGAALDGGEWETLDADRLAACIGSARPAEVRARLAAAARALVDGQGASRVVESLWNTPRPGGG